MAVIEATDTDFDSKLAEHEKVIVKYFADWCGTCKLFAPKYLRLSENARFQDIIFLEVNAEQNVASRKKARVDNLPYFATFENGELKEYFSTSLESKVEAMLEKLEKA